MVGMSTTDRVDKADVTVGIVDGRVSMSAQVDADLAVETPDHTPLSAAEPHLTLRVADSDVRVVIDLNGPALDALADVVQAAADGGES